MNHQNRLAIGGLAALSLLAGTTHAASGTDNSIITAIERIDDCTNPSAQFGILLDVLLPGGGATGVEMTTAAGLHVILENEEEGEWFGEAQYPDMESLTDDANGLWTVTITGGSVASTSTFTLDLAELDLADFYTPPANIQPASGPVGTEVTFTWDDPTTGGNPPDVLFVDTDYQAADLAIDETSWTPPLPLTTGPNSFAVGYYYAADAGTASPLVVTDGAITWGLPPLAPKGYPASTPLAAFGAETIRCYDVQAGEAANTILIFLDRIDDNVFPENAFLAFVDVTLEDSDVTGVNLVTAGGLDVDLEFDEDFWCTEADFGDLAALRDALNGEWTITIEGPTPSVSTLTMNLGGLVEGDFFDSPTNVFPAHGATSVPADVVFTWDDPTPPGAADLLFAETDQFDAISIDGTIDIGATSWAPPLPLDDGQQEFFVGYAKVADAGLAGPIAVEPPGAIAWGLPGFAPAGYPSDAPLALLAAETAVAFTVGVDCPADVSGDGVVGFADILAMLGAWGPCEGCPEDADGNGEVGFSDVLMVLANWGEC